MTGTGLGTLALGTLALVHWPWYPRPWYPRPCYTGPGILGPGTLALVHWLWYTCPGTPWHATLGTPSWYYPGMPPWVHPPVHRAASVSSPQEPYTAVAMHECPFDVTGLPFTIYRWQSPRVVDASPVLPLVGLSRLDRSAMHFSPLEQPNMVNLPNSQ